MIVRIFALFLAMALPAPAAAAGGDEPGDYAVRVAIAPSPGSSLQRVNLPARVLVAARSPELADVRIFNAAGQAVPIARSTAPAPQRRQSIALPVLPILGAADALAVTGVSLRIDDQQHASVVRVDGTPQTATGSQVLGILLDARRITDPISGLSLDMATPQGQPVTITVERSADLKDWQPVADEVVYRTSNQTAVTIIGFPPGDLHGSYLRVTWRATSRLLAPVKIRAAAAVTMRNFREAQAPRTVLLVPSASDHHTIEFTLPFAAPIAALEIEPRGIDTVIPIRILGRDHKEQPWTPIASGSLFRVISDGRSRANLPFNLNGSRFHILRVEADERSAGFDLTPRIAARLAPVQLVFLATGGAPYTLAAGNPAASPAFLPLNDLLQASGSARSVPLPMATIATEPDPVVNLVAPDQGMPWRQVALWGVLLAATALLAGMVWLLMRRREPMG